MTRICDSLLLPGNMDIDLPNLCLRANMLLTKCYWSKKIIIVMRATSCHWRVYFVCDMMWLKGMEAPLTDQWPLQCNCAGVSVSPVCPAAGGRLTSVLVPVSCCQAAVWHGHGHTHNIQQFTAVLGGFWPLQFVTIISLSMFSNK